MHRGTESTYIDIKVAGTQRWLVCECPPSSLPSFLDSFLLPTLYLYLYYYIYTILLRAFMLDFGLLDFLAW